MKTCGLDVHKDSIFCVIYDGKSNSVVKAGALFLTRVLIEIENFPVFHTLW
jgi:hypothetical protein